MSIEIIVNSADTINNALNTLQNNMAADIRMRIPGVTTAAGVISLGFTPATGMYHLTTMYQWIIPERRALWETIMTSPPGDFLEIYSTDNVYDLMDVLERLVVAEGPVGGYRRRNRNKKSKNRKSRNRKSRNRKSRKM
jgi:hypothetical protein